MDMEALKEEIRCASDGLGGMTRVPPLVSRRRIWNQLREKTGRGCRLCLAALLPKGTALAVRREMEEKHPVCAQTKVRFESWLAKNAPYLSILWDFERHYLSLAMVDILWLRSPHKQAIISCRFAARVWLGNNV